MEEKKTVDNSRSEGNLHPKTIGRAAVLLGIAVLLFSALLVRIFLLQTVKYEHYRQKVLEQITTESSVNASRGNIYDANGVLLATNVTTYRVFISPRSIKEASDETGVDYADMISHGLSERLEDVSYEDVQFQTTKTQYLDRTIARKVTSDVAKQIRTLIAENGLEDMIYLEATATRYYPYGSTASTVLGFTGTDNQGLAGIEMIYENYLKGLPGRIVTAKNAAGTDMPYKYEKYIDPENGVNVVLTIDEVIQHYVENELETAKQEQKYMQIQYKHQAKISV